MPNVQVAVRCRPPLEAESSIPATKLRCDDAGNTIRVGLSQNQDKVFSFDRVLAEHSTQEDVFDFVSPLLDHALDGFHATVFAYGQTGSGKTHTMEGFAYQQDSHGQIRPDIRNTPKAQHGIIPRAVEALYERAHVRMQHNPTIKYVIKCSYLQLYNEKVMDLLSPQQKKGPTGLSAKEGLRIRWTTTGQFVVDNLFTFECETAEDVRELFNMGVRNKTMGSHHMNIQSSRSHCLLTLYISSFDPTTPDCVVKSQLTLVDLAGSEKLALLSQNPSSQLLKESIDINTSLLCLGKVITALSTESGAKGHVPYRDSKLTRLLKHALGGNSMTLMIACVNPLDAYVEESLSTMIYAGRAKKITNDPRINEDPRTAMIRQLREEIASLKLELAHYRQLVLDGGMVPQSTTDLRNANSGGTPSAHATTTGKSVPGAVAMSATDMADNAALGEKLIESCRMLKDIIKVNGDLRNAFDKVQEGKAAAERRELELNAENEQLRERIEMLESIALTDDGKPRGGGARSGAPSKRSASSGNRGGGDEGGEYPAAKQQAQPASGDSDARRSTTNLASNPSFVERLNMYNSRYRNPTKSANYSDYYGVAVKKRVNASGGSYAPPPIQQQPKLSKETENVLNLVKKSGERTATLVPQSMFSTTTYGALDFGGSAEEKAEMEERRRQRQLRLQQLQQQHEQMQQGVARAIFATPKTPPELPTGGFSSSDKGTPRTPPPDLKSRSFTSGVGAGRRAQPLTSSPSTSSSASGPATGKLFSYLSSHESSSVFTDQQLAVLQRRATDLHQSSSSKVARSAGLSLPPTTTAPMAPGTKTVPVPPAHYARQEAHQQQQKYQQQLYDAQQAILQRKK